jgi:hypothetical protein
MSLGLSVWIVLSEFARVLLILFETFSYFFDRFWKIDVDLKYIFWNFLSDS